MEELTYAATKADTCRDKAGSVTMRVSGAALMVLVMAGCATPLKRTYLGDGTSAIEVKCDGMGKTRHDCLQIAGNLCTNAGFEVLSEAGEKSQFGIASGTQSAAAAYVGSSERRSMFFRCKSESTEAAQTLTSKLITDKHNKAISRLNWIGGSGLGVVGGIFFLGWNKGVLANEDFWRWANLATISTAAVFAYRFIRY